MAFSDLPRELEFEILSRVPATSLARLRSTCKRWYALFKDPSFIDRNYSSKEATTKQLVFYEDYGVYSVSLDLNVPSVEFTGKLKSLKDSSQHVQISEIFVCDGLLLCTTKDNRLVVWNPCTGQIRWIQPENRKTFYEIYALGYENNNSSCDHNSYKILRSSYSNNPLMIFPQVEFDIYEFNSDSWRALDGVTCSWKIVNRPGVSLKGNTYWIVWGIQDHHQNNTFLLKFDFRRERFERLPLPFEYAYTRSVTVRLSVVRQEKLYVLLQRPHMNTLEMKIWVTTDTNKLDEAKDTKIYYSLVVDFGKIMIKGMMRVESFCVELEENRMVLCCYHRSGKRIMIGVIRIHDRKIHVCKDFHGEEITQGSITCWPCLISYVPSLVQIQQLKRQKRKRKRA